MTRTLTALPIYNEANTVNAVLDEVLNTAMMCWWLTTDPLTAHRNY